MEEMRNMEIDWLAQAYGLIRKIELKPKSLDSSLPAK